MKEQRCKYCNKKLGEIDGNYSIICPRCGKLNEYKDDKLQTDVKSNIIK